MRFTFTKYRIHLLLALFFVIGLFLRLYILGSVPGGFHEDEAHIGYNAYSLLKTLHDKNNVFLPLAVDQFGDFRPSGLHFLTIPSIALFGLTEFATRLPVAIVGALSVIIFYLLAYEIFRKKEIALMASAMMVINPWQFIASRSTSESIVSLFFVMLGIYGLLVFIRRSKENKSSRSKNIGIALLAFLSLIVSFQFYHAARYFVPLLLLFILFFVAREKAIAKNSKITIVLGIIVVFGALLFLIKFGGGGGRVDEISIFTNPATEIELFDQTKEDKGLPALLVRFFHNKLLAYSYTASVNYGEHFTPDFLFFKGGLPPRYMVPWNGNYYPIDALFMIVGFCILLTMLLQKKHGSWLTVLPFVWLALGPLPAAFTFEDIPHFQRAIMMMPALLLISAYGFYFLTTNIAAKKNRSVFLTIISVILVYQVALFMHDYFHHTLTHNAKFRNEGEKELVLAMNEYKKEKRNIIMTSQGANNVIFYLFYNKMDPATYQKLGSPRDANNLEFDGAVYKSESCPSYAYSPPKGGIKYPDTTIYVDSGDCLPRTGLRLIKAIKRPDNTVAFRIIGVDPATQTKMSSQ